MHVKSKKEKGKEYTETKEKGGKKRLRVREWGIHTIEKKRSGPPQKQV